MGKIEFTEKKKKFITACEAYSKKVDAVKHTVINNDLAISTEDLMCLVRQKEKPDKLLRRAYCFKYYGVPLKESAIPMYGDIADMYHTWRNYLSFPILYSADGVHNYDIFSLDEDNFPCVDMQKVEIIANKLYTKQYGKDIEIRLNALESIAKELSNCNGNIGWVDIKRYIIEEDNGSYTFDKDRYIAENV